jgi:hypothetical protein
MAPEKGSETRKRLADSAGDWMEKAKNSLVAARKKKLPVHVPKVINEPRELHRIIIQGRC